MKAKYNVYEIFFYSILIAIMVLSLTLGIRDAIGITMEIKLILYYIAIVIVPITIMRALPRKVWIIIIIALAGIVLYLYQNGIVFTTINYLFNFAESIWRYLTYQSYFNIKYTNIFIFLFILLSASIISIFTFLYGKKAKILLIFIGIISMTYFWFIYVEKAKIYLMYYLFASILYYSYQVFKEKEANWKSIKNIKDSRLGLYWVVNSGVIVLFSLIISLAFPMNIKPIRWSWLDNAFLNVFPFIVEWRSDTLDSYTYGYSSRYNPKSLGYSDKALGGPVNLNKNIMLELKTIKFERPLYLKGIVKDVYSGKGWKKSEKQAKAYMASGIAVNEYSSEIKTNRLEIDILPKSMMTSTIFYPYSLGNANYKGNKFYLDDDSEAYFSKRIKPGETYTVTALQPLVNVQKLKIDTSDANNKYRELPEGISQRVKSLSTKLTANKNNDFEKVKAIETYLRNNYRYTLTPSRVPSDKEFVDYFLYEGKEGYCTYFATSMAVLLRAAGIPCRYVEGFLVNEDSWNGREYLIKGTSAHAWVEVRFEDSGWMTFEATPAYETFEYETATEAAEEIEKHQEDKSLQYEGNIVIPTARNKEILRDFDEETTGETQTVKQINYKSYILIIFIIIFFVWFGTFIYRYSKFARLEPETKQLAMLLAFYSLIGISIKPHETIRQFFNRAKVYDGDLIVLDKNIILLEKSIYGGSTLDDKEKEELGIYMKDLKTMTIKKVGWVKYAISWLFHTNQYCKYIF